MTDASKSGKISLFERSRIKFVHYYHYLCSHSSNRVKNARSNVRFITTKTHSFDLGQKKLTLIVTEKLRYATKIFCFLKFVQNSGNTSKCKQMFGQYKQIKKTYAKLHKSFFQYSIHTPLISSSTFL